ncbi:MAG: hypothetical protein GX771_12210 [Halomonadaceae bacterium]|nr:hypothetical protein [Halomonadaceae bacterium]
MIKFVTDHKPGEPNILEGNDMKPLLVKNLDGDLLSTLVPSEPWTHEGLCGLALETFVDEKAIRYGADAYLGDVWIGSTEI